MDLNYQILSEFCIFRGKMLMDWCELHSFHALCATKTHLVLLDDDKVNWWDSMLGLCHDLHIHWPLTMEAQVQSQCSPCGIYNGQSDIRTGYFLSTSVFLSHFHCNSVQYSYNGQSDIRTGYFLSTSVFLSHFHCNSVQYSYVFHVSSSLYNFSKWGHY